VTATQRSCRSSSPVTTGWAVSTVTPWAVCTVVGSRARHAQPCIQPAGRPTAAISERGAQTLLDGLLALGLVELVEGTYRNTAEASSYLIEGRPLSPR
jgi:hypothetical protein